MKALVLSVAVLAGVLAGAASADPNYVIRKDTDIGGFKLSDDPTLRAAIDAYGSSTSRVPYEGQACIVVWSQFGIRITFSHVVSTTPCDGRGCHSETCGVRKYDLAANGADPDGGRVYVPGKVSPQDSLITSPSRLRVARQGRRRRRLVNRQARRWREGINMLAFTVTFGLTTLIIVILIVVVLYLLMRRRRR
jgi:hypothetical protein